MLGVQVLPIGLEQSGEMPQQQKLLQSRIFYRTFKRGDGWCKIARTGVCSMAVQVFSAPHPIVGRASNYPLAIGKKLWAINSEKEVLRSELEEKRKGGGRFL